MPLDSELERVLCDSPLNRTWQSDTVWRLRLITGASFSISWNTCCWISFLESLCWAVRSLSHLGYRRFGDSSSWLSSDSQSYLPAVQMGLLTPSSTDLSCDLKENWSVESLWSSWETVMSFGFKPHRKLEAILVNNNTARIHELQPPLSRTFLWELWE